MNTTSVALRQVSIGIDLYLVTGDTRVLDAGLEMYPAAPQQRHSAKPIGDKTVDIMLGALTKIVGVKPKPQTQPGEE